MKRGEKTRIRLQETALKLFAEKGIAETSIRDIADDAGIAEGTMYRHYKSKDALSRDLFLTNYADLAQRLDDLQLRAVGLRNKLSVVVQELCLFFDRDPLLFRFLLLSQHHYLRDVVRDRQHNPVETVRMMIAEAIEAQEIPVQDTDLATALVMGQVLQPATFLVYGRLRPPFVDHAPTIIDAAWASLTWSVSKNGSGG